MPYTTNTYPTTIQSNTAPIASDDTATIDVAGFYKFENDSILALKNKVGVDSSAVTTSIDYKLSSIPAAGKAASLTGTETLTNKTLTSPTITGGTQSSPTITTPTITIGSDATGDVYGRSAGGGVARIVPGASGQVLTSNGVATAPTFQTPNTVTSSQVQNQSFTYAADTGTSTAYVVTLSPALASYAAGQEFEFKASNTNTTTTPTVNVNALGAKTIINPDGTAVSVGQIPLNGIVKVVYDGTNMQIQTNSNKDKPLLNQVFTFINNTSTAASHITCSTAGVSTTEPFFSISSNSGATLSRFLKTSDGGYYCTHSTGLSSFGGASRPASIAVIGSFVYILSDNGAGSPILVRLSKTDLTGEVIMTISGTALTLNSSIFTDGTNLYNMYTSGTARIYSISGTTATSGSTVSYTSSTVLAPYWSDGISLYSLNSAGTNTYKWAIGGGARTTNTFSHVAQSFIVSSGSIIADTGGIFKDQNDTSKIAIIIVASSAIVSGRINLIPIF